MDEATTELPVSSGTLEGEWSYELFKPPFFQSNQECINVKVYFCGGSAWAIACWKDCVPHLLGDIVGFIPGRFEQKIINAAKSLYASLSGKR